MAAVTSERPASSLESPPTGEGLTFEKVWAMFQEYKEQMRLEATERQKEAAERQAEWEKESAKRQAEWKKEAAERQKELDRRMGDLSNRFGELAEHLVAPCIHERFNELGYHFDAVAPGGYVIRDERGKITAEVDMLLENSDCIMAVEVKTKTRVKDIEHHVKRLEILREYRNKHNDTRKIMGAVASPILGAEEKKAILEAGFYVIEQSGDTMKIDVPDGFVPQVW
ncbi:MAG: transketolase [Treponema sp.]|jgi:hypothetical protein|nr:transketolase [Treponema sp.]